MSLLMSAQVSFSDAATDSPPTFEIVRPTLERCPRGALPLPVAGNEPGDPLSGQTSSG